MWTGRRQDTWFKASKSLEDYTKVLGAMKDVQVLS